MFKRWISLLVTVTMLASLFSATAFAQEPAQADGTQVVTTVEGTGDAADTADKSETADADKPETGDTGSGSGDSAEPTTDGAPTDGDSTDPEAEQEPLTNEAIADPVAAAAAALAALPDEITWDAFAAVEAAGAALAAVPADLQAQVEGASKLQPAIDALLQIYNDALAALDPTADVWENQRAIKTFAAMKQQMDAALYVKPAADMSLMGDEAADLSWLDAALLAYADAEVCIIPAGGDMSLMATPAVADCDTLQAAIDKVEDGQTILVKKNLKIEGSVFASNDTTYTINTNKKTLAFINVQLLFDTGNVTVNGGGIIDGTKTLKVLEIRDKYDTPVLTLDNITVLSNKDDGREYPAVSILGGKSITIQNCTFDGTTAFGFREYSDAEKITIKDTVIRTFGNIGDGETAMRLICSTASRTVVIDNVDIETNYQQAISIQFYKDHSTNVTIQNCNLKTTHPSGNPILSIDGTSTDGFPITVSNTRTYPALTDEKCIPAEGQFNFLNKAVGGSIVTAGLDNAFAISDSIALTGDYTADAPIVIPQGKTLDTGDYVLAAESITVNGTLCYTKTDTLATATTVTSTGTLKDNATGIVQIGPKASDDAAVKPVYGLHAGAEMSLTKAANVITFSATKGDITIQNAFNDGNTFSAPGDKPLSIDEENATVWIASDMSLSSTNNITGTIHYIAATNAKGTKQYETLYDAVKNETSVKVVRDLKDGDSHETQTIVIDKAMTIDFGGHEVHVYGNNGSGYAGFVIGTSKKINVTLKNGTVVYDATNEGITNAVAIRATDKATVTLDNLTAQVKSNDSNSGAVLRVEDGATVSTINGELLASGSYGVVYVLPGGTLKANGTQLSGNRPVIAYGRQDTKATVALTGANMDSPFLVGEYVTLSMTDCDVAIADGALPIMSSVDGGSKGTNVTITGGTLKSTNTTNRNGIRPYATNSFSMTGVELTVTGNGIALYSGDITLNDVTVSAGEAALSVIAGSSEVDPVNLTINGGSYTTTGDTAFIYGHAGGAERTLNIKSEGARFIGTASIAYSGNGTAPKVETSAMVACPAVVDGLLNTSSAVFTAKLDGKDAAVVAKSLSEAFAIAGDGTITLQEDYISENESVELTQGQTLNVNGKNLTLKSLTSYGNVIATGESLITASKFVQYGGAGQDFKSNGVTLQRPATLAEGTVLEARPLATWGENFTPLISIVELCPDTDYTYVVSAFDAFYPEPVKNVLLCGSSGAFGTVSISAKKDGEDTVAQITVLEGTMAIYANTATVLDGGKNWLIIEDDARVVAGDKMCITSTANIEGDLYMPEVDVFMAAVALLPEKVAELTHDDYDLVLAARKAWDDMDGYKDIPIADDSKAKLENIEKVYLDYYISTAPVDTLFLLSTDGVISLDRSAQVPSIIRLRMLPDNVWARMNDTTYYEVDYVLSDNDKFTLNTSVTPATISTTESAQAGDELTLYVYFKGKGDLSGFQSEAATVKYTVLPAQADGTLKEVVLTSNTYTVNKQKTSQAVTIPVLFASSNGVVYEDDIYTMTTGDGLTLVGEGKNKLSDVYDIAFDQANSSIVLTPIDVKTLAKNKTYTGRINFGTVKKGDTTYQVPNSALISVKVTDVAPKVTVKVANADLVNATVRNDEACTIVCNNAVTLSGVNKDDVEEIEFQNYGDVTFRYVSSTLTIKSTAPLTKGMTLKPVVKITYTETSGFATTYPTVSIKITETTPAVKLAKTSATISGKAGDVVTVQLVATNKKDPFILNRFKTVVEVLKTAGKEYVTNDVATAKYTYYFDEENPTATITITLQKDVEKSEKLTLRLLTTNNNGNKVGNKYLPFTLNVKPLSAKLQKSSVTLNVKSNTPKAEVGVIVTPESAGVTLVKVGDAVAVKGVATVDGIKFTCNNAKAVEVDASAATLVKGTKKYSLTFVGIAKPLTLTVKVEDKYQTAKLSKSSLAINTTLLNPQDDYTIDYGEVMLKYSDGVLAEEDLTIEKSSDDVDVTYNKEDGRLTVRLKRTAPKVATVTVRINDDANVDPKKSALKLTVKRNDKPLTLKVTVNGKLDPLNDQSAVTMSAKLSGTLAADALKPLLTNIPQRLDNINWKIDLANNDVLAASGPVGDAGRYIVGWQGGANEQYGAGKFNINVSLSSDNFGADQELLTTTKPITFTAAEPKVKLTAQTVTLYESLPYRSASLTISAGDAGKEYEINNVWLQKDGGAYTVERIATDRFAIRYADGKVDFGSKWKAKDTLKLNVTFLGSSKVYTVTVPIINVEAQKTE